MVDTYLALGSLPVGQSEAAQLYVNETEAIVNLIGAPSEPLPAWRAIASQEIGDLSNGQNWD